jgi:hypothetical protein
MVGNFGPKSSQDFTLSDTSSSIEFRTFPFIARYLLERCRSNPLLFFLKRLLQRVDYEASLAYDGALSDKAIYSLEPCLISILSESCVLIRL